MSKQEQTKISKFEENKAECRHCSEPSATDVARTIAENNSEIAHNMTVNQALGGRKGAYQTLPSCH